MPGSGVAGHRHGSRRRTDRSFGKLEITVPRARLEGSLRRRLSRLRFRKVSVARVPWGRDDADQSLRSVEEGRDLGARGLENNLLNAVGSRVEQHIGGLLR